MMEAILWKWPGAQCVVRGGVLERWDGPMPEPTAKELADAVADYQTQGMAKRQWLEQTVGAPLVQALLRAFAPALGTTAEAATAVLIAELDETPAVPVGRPTRARKTRTATRNARRKQ